MENILELNITVEDITYCFYSDLCVFGSSLYYLYLLFVGQTWSLSTESLYSI